MIVEFTLGNYRSYLEPQTLSFEATEDLSISTNVTDLADIRLLKSIALYGPNGSGKSNVLHGITNMLRLIVHSGKHHKTEELNIDNFKLNTESPNRPSLFEIVVYINNQFYKYGFEADNSEIHREYLFIGETPYIEREDNKLTTHPELDNGSLDYINPNQLVFSVLNQRKSPALDNLWVYLTNTLVVRGNLSERNTKQLSFKLLMNDDSKTKFINKFKLKDLSVKDINLSVITIDSLPIEEEEKEKLKSDNRSANNLYFRTDIVHNVYDNSKNVVGTTAFRLETKESDGVQKLFDLLGPLSSIGDNQPRLILIDEIDSSLHTLQTINLIRDFHNESLNAQLLFTTHDIMLLDKADLRRDQIYFVEKDEVEASKTYSLADFIENNDTTTVADNYLGGRYGAIPFIEVLTKDRV